MTKHTPGPWRLIDRKPSGPSKISNPNLARYWIAKESDNPEWRGPTEICGQINEANALADARLIAAAPDMLECLEWVLQHCPCTVQQRQSGHLSGCWAPEVEIVITKAKGKDVD